MLLDKEIRKVVQEMYESRQLKPNQFSGQAFNYILNVVGFREGDMVYYGMVNIDNETKMPLEMSYKTYYFHSNGTEVIGDVFHPLNPVSKLFERKSTSYLFAVSANQIRS